MSENNPHSTSDRGSARGPIDPSGAMSPPQPPPGLPPYAYPPPQPQKGGVIRKFLLGGLLSLFVLSVLMNFYQAQILAVLLSGPHESVYLDGDEEQRILIIPVEGVINEGKYEFIDYVFRKLDQNEQDLPKAIVLRVDSPGGAVGASDRIHQTIKAFKEKHSDIPVVASFGSVAASGGYYISASCDHIVAEPTCITGSIGVIAQTFTLKGLMDKIGVEPNVLTADTSPKKAVANNMFEPFDDEDKAKIKHIINDMHVQFMKVVQEGRARVIGDETFTSEHTQSVSSGDTFNTKEAIANKLVDSEGYLTDAIEQARKMANLTGDVRVTVMNMPQPLINLNFFFKSDANPPTADEARTWLREVSSPRLEYLWEPGM